jgi:thioredoxin-related protein
MSHFGKAGLVSLAAFALAADGQAAPDRASDASRQSAFEIVVVEAEGCIYCPVLRRDVVPAYRATPRAERVPLRFADVEAIEAGVLALAGPIEAVPTVLVLKGREEIGRLAGYAGRENFLRSIDGLLAGVE